MTERDHADDTAFDGTNPADDEIDPGWPWSFVLLVVAGAIYLIFRFAELGISLFT